MLLLQEKCANALKDAIDIIETQPPKYMFEFTFACQCANVKSIACAVLLASLVYPEAEIKLWTFISLQGAMKAVMNPHLATGISAS